MSGFEPEGTGFDFAASMREAEERAIQEYDAENPPEPEAEAPADSRPRNELGQFVAQEPDPEPEAEAQPEVEAQPEPETPAEQLLAGRFKSVEDLERGYQELLRMDGQKSNELGELRKAFEERLEGFEQQLNQPRQAPQQITAELIEQNPAAAVQLAYEQQNPHALQVAMEAWRYEDPFSAALWVSERQMERRDQQWEQRLNEVRSQYEPVAKHTEDQQWAAAYQGLQAKYPDLDQLAPAMSELAPEYPVVLQALQSGTPDSKAKALESLYLIARGRNAGNLQAAGQAVAQQSDADSEAARQAAFVASATQTSAPPVLSEEQAEAQRFHERIVARQERWDSGWERSK